MRLGLQRLGLLSLWLGCQAANPASMTADDARPWLTATAVSVDRVQSRIDVLLELAGHPELADVLAERFSRVDDWPGIDRQRPLQWLCLQADEDTESRPTEVLRIPTTDPDRLMETITGDVVEFRKVAENVFEIDRPDDPYFVLIHLDEAWCGDSIDQLRRLAELSTRRKLEPAKSYDLRFDWNFQAFPSSRRQAIAQSWLHTVEPWQQQRDDETDESYRIRRAWTDGIRLLGQSLIEDLRSVSAELRVLPDERKAVVTIRAEMNPQHRLQSLWTNWRAVDHPWNSWSKLDTARASGYLQLPDWFSSESGKRPSVLAVQVYGDHLPVRQVVLVHDRGSEPHINRSLSSAESQPEQTIQRIPRVPDWVRHWIGGAPEMRRIDERDVTWWGFGPPDLARERLESTWRQSQLSNSMPVAGDEEPAAIAELRIPFRELSGWFPWVDPVWAGAQIGSADDRLSCRLFVQPTQLQITIEIPEGGLKLVGGWIAQDLNADWRQYLLSP